MRVRLIQPAQLDGENRPIKYRRLFLPFLALPTLAGMTPSGVDVRITEEYVQDVDFDEDVDLVGITAQTSQAPRAYQIATEFRKRGKKVIMGGIHASMCTNEALDHVDSVLVGEAEDVWEGILEDAQRGSLQRVYRAESRPDLSRLVIPRFDLLDYGNYVIPPFASTPLLPFQTSRGCPYNCDFCSVIAFLGRTVRKKPVEHVVREIEANRPSRILFTDDNITADPAYAKELFRAIRPFGIRWACQMSTRILDHPELIDLAAKSGCHETFIGVESMNAEALMALRKSHNRVNEYPMLFKRLKSVGILPQVSLMFGLDGDRVDSLKQTVDNMMKWDVNYLYIFVFTPLPGTRAYEQMAENGRLTTSDWSRYDCFSSTIEPTRLSGEQVLSSVGEVNRAFYSTRAIGRRLLKFLPQYIRYPFRDRMYEEVFFSLQMRRAVRQGRHPFTLGQ